MRAGKTPAFIIALWYSRNSVSELSMLTARSLSAVLKLLKSRARSSRASAHPSGPDEMYTMNAWPGAFRKTYNSMQY